jgi:hypothetical protein
VDPRAGLEYFEKKKFLILQGLEFRPLSRPVRNNSLYRLPYPGTLLTHNINCSILFHWVDLTLRSTLPTAIQHTRTSVQTKIFGTVTNTEPKINQQASKTIRQTRAQQLFMALK